MSESSDLCFSPVSRSSPLISRSDFKSEATIQQEKNAEFTSELISWVKRVTILYDHFHKQYRNAEKKLAAWNYVKEKVGYLGEAQELADHFKIIRDRYTKAKRKIASEKPSKFQFFEEMRFLDPHIKTVDVTRQKIIKTPKINSVSFYFRLIELVRENSCFYDHHDPNYRKYSYKCQIWNKIAQELAFDGGHHEIYKQWKKLRDRYVREIKKLRLNGRNKATCKWEFFNNMDWMESFIEEPRPLEDFEIPLENNNMDLESQENTTAIYENGKKTAEFKILKPAKKDSDMPTLLPEVNPSTFYANYSEVPHPVVIYTDSDQDHIIVSKSDDMSGTLQPEITYYIEENDVTNLNDDEQYILTSNISHDVDEHQELSDAVNFPTEIIINYQEVDQPSSSSSSRNIIYAVHKHTDLSSLPENIRLAVEAQGKDVFKDKSTLYVK